MFKKAMTAGIALAAFATVHVASIGAARADMPNPLTFGIISTESSQGLKKSFNPFLEDMGKQLGVEVKATAPTAKSSCRRSTSPATQAIGRCC